MLKIVGDDFREWADEDGLFIQFDRAIVVPLAALDFTAIVVSQERGSSQPRGISMGPMMKRCMSHSRDSSRTTRTRVEMGFCMAATPQTRPTVIDVVAV